VIYVEWLFITFNTTGISENEEIIRKRLKPNLEALQKIDLIKNFWFFQYAGNETKLKLYVNGDGNKLRELFSDADIVSYDPDNDQTEIHKYGRVNWSRVRRLFEIGSRSAFIYMGQFDIKNSPQDLMLMVHSLLQNIGCNYNEEKVIGSLLISNAEAAIK
jgi:hypothetical protein